MNTSSSPFSYQGPIEASKSLLNRALICQSFSSDLVLRGDSLCDDVVHMKNALKGLNEGRKRLHCGEGGTTFRFMLLRASRFAGDFHIEADSKLLKRPQQELLTLLGKLGVAARRTEDGIVLSGSGWVKPSQLLEIDMGVSSQFASALVLSAWNLEFDLEFQLTGQVVSEEYFSMTIRLVEELGMKIQKLPGFHFIIPAGQRISVAEYSVEPDVSSTFAVAALAALKGQLTVTEFPSSSLQPDFVFLDILKKMKIRFEVSNNQLVVKKTQNILPISIDLKNSPDLFPVLSVLCSFVDGESVLFGAPHLVAKESDRIGEVSKLFKLLNISHTSKSDGMIIYGDKNRKFDSGTVIDFDPASDHRMVMAAALAKAMGAPLKINNIQCVNKSFPQFKTIAKDYL